jgi:hypothetical protein
MIHANTTLVKAIVYGLIAALTALITDLDHVRDLNSLQSGDILRIILNIFLQICIAVKAFFDPTVTSSSNTTTNISNSEVNIEEFIQREDKD